MGISPVGASPPYDCSCRIIVWFTPKIGENEQGLFSVNSIKSLTICFSFMYAWTTAYAPISGMLIILRASFWLNLLMLKLYGGIKSHSKGGGCRNALGFSWKQGGKYSEKKPVLRISLSMVTYSESDSDIIQLTLLWYVLFSKRLQIH